MKKACFPTNTSIVPDVVSSLPHKPRVGLVLGGGGMVGAAYHTGVLLALYQDLGWDARQAEVVVGTSAGAIIGGLIRMEVDPLDLAAGMTGISDPIQTWAIPQLPPFRLRDMRVRRPRWPQMRHWLRRPWETHPVGLATGLLADGQVDLGGLLASIQMAGDWPTGDLRLVAVRDSDRQRVVFDRFDRGGSLTEAVTASCAIPGYARSVIIGEHNYLDGGLHSPTNADLLIGSGVDMAVVVSPLTGRHRGPRRSLRLVERWARGRLEEELRLLEAAGIPAVVIAPEPQVSISFGPSLLDGTNLGAIVRDSFLSTGGQIGRDPWRTGLLTLDGRGVLSRASVKKPRSSMPIGEAG